MIDSPDRITVLMVTGAYYPELSGGGLQCKAIVDTLRGAARFLVLTTCTTPSLPAAGEVDGTPVYRVHVDVRRRLSKTLAAVAFTRRMLALSRSIDVVHLHGFSGKASLVIWLARMLGKPVVLTLHTAEQDEPEGVRALGQLAYRAYANIDLFIAISSRMAERLIGAGLAASRVWRGSNGVDLDRFRPSSAGERAELRRSLGLPAGGPLILFVGFFSRDKGPQVLFDAWQGLVGDGSCLVFVGTTGGQYYEIDPALARGIRETADRLGRAERVVFVGETTGIEQYFRAADVFVMPSRREAFGMVLIEAMASGLPCIASRLAGVTDEIVRDGETGLLVEPHDVPALAAALKRLLGDRRLADRLGAAARRDVEARYAIEITAGRMLEAYQHVLVARAALPVSV
jgi:glycosyltransferase involved in cell wall biosynthesis